MDEHLHRYRTGEHLGFKNAETTLTSSWDNSKPGHEQDLQQKSTATTWYWGAWPDLRILFPHTGVKDSSFWPQTYLLVS